PRALARAGQHLLERALVGDGDVGGGRGRAGGERRVGRSGRRGAAVLAVAVAPGPIAARAVAGGTAARGAGATRAASAARAARAATGAAAAGLARRRRARFGARGGGAGGALLLGDALPERAVVALLGRAGPRRRGLLRRDRRHDALADHHRALRLGLLLVGHAARVIAERGGMSSRRASERGRFAATRAARRGMGGAPWPVGWSSSSRTPTPPRCGSPGPARSPPGRWATASTSSSSGRRSPPPWRRAATAITLRRSCTRRAPRGR